MTQPLPDHRSMLSSCAHPLLGYCCEAVQQDPNLTGMQMHTLLISDADNVIKALAACSAAGLSMPSPSSSTSGRIAPSRLSISRPSG